MHFKGRVLLFRMGLNFLIENGKFLILKLKAHLEPYQTLMWWSFFAKTVDNKVLNTPLLFSKYSQELYSKTSLLLKGWFLFITLFWYIQKNWQYITDLWWKKWFNNMLTPTLNRIRDFSWKYINFTNEFVLKIKIVIPIFLILPRKWCLISWLLFSCRRIFRTFSNIQKIPS